MVFEESLVCLMEIVTAGIEMQGFDKEAIRRGGLAERRPTNPADALHIIGGQLLLMAPQEIQCRTPVLFVD